MLLLNNNNTNTNNRNISIIVVIVIGGVFGADHQRVPIASNGPAAIRPLLSHLLLRKHDLNRFFAFFLVNFYLQAASKIYLMPFISLLVKQQTFSGSSDAIPSKFTAQKKSLCKIC